LILVTWTVSDPGAVGVTLADRLRLPRPDMDAEAVGFELRGGLLRFVRPEPASRAPLDERLEVASTAWQPPAGGTARIELLGIGWSTVELDRAAGSVGVTLGIDPGAFAPATDDGWLGARTRRAASPDGLVVVLLEPTTEGRLAAALARLGEGPIALYLGLPGPASGTVRPGPLGASTLVHAARPWGPYVFGVASAATIGL
jgi:hypothetical protein